VSPAALHQVLTSTQQENRTMSTASRLADRTAPARRLRTWAAERRLAARRDAELERALAGDYGPGVLADVLAAQERAAA
jgi:hypothetical protein